MTARVWERKRIPRVSGYIGFSIGAALIAVFLFAYYIYTWRSFYHFQYAIDECVRPFCDFTDFYYPMGEAIFGTGLPVKGFLYSPFFGILMALFVPLGLDVSVVVWGILQILFVVFYLHLFRRLVPAGLSMQLLFVALALSSFPLLHTLSWGQVSIFMTVAVLGMIILLERERYAFAAALFAFAVSFKFYPLIFLTPFVARRDTRFLFFAIAGCGAFLFIIPGILLGVDDTLRFYSALLDSYRASGWIAGSYNSQYLPHVLLRLAKSVGYNVGDYLPILYLIGYGVVAANVGLVFLIQRARLPYANLWSFHILFLSIPFFLKTSWPVDLVYLSFGQALVIWKLLGKEERTRVRAVVTRFLLLISIIFSNIVFFNLFIDRYWHGFYGFIFWADLFLLTASYIELVSSAMQQTRVTSRLMFRSDMVVVHDHSSSNERSRTILVS